MDRSNDAKCEAQADRADLGMCLITAKPGGDQIDLSDGGGVGDTGLAVVVLTTETG